MSEQAKAIVTAWFRDQWPGSTNLDPHVDGDYKKLTKHIALALAELERHQAEAAKAIRNLAPLGGCRDHVYEKEGCEICAAIQRAREHGKT